MFCLYYNVRSGAPGSGEASVVVVTVYTGYRDPKEGYN